MIKILGKFTTYSIQKKKSVNNHILDTIRKLRYIKFLGDFSSYLQNRLIFYHYKKKLKIAFKIYQLSFSINNF